MKFLLTLFICLGLQANVFAKKYHDDNDYNNDDDWHHKKRVVVVEKKVVVERFSDDDRDVVATYYKRHKIPPGQAKKMRHVDIVVGETAPPDVFRLFAPVPLGLLPMLPPPPPGVGFYLAGNQIVRVNKRSHKVLDRIPIGDNEYQDEAVPPPHHKSMDRVPVPPRALPPLPPPPLPPPFFPIPPH